MIDLANSVLDSHNQAVKALNSVSDSDDIADLKKIKRVRDLVMYSRKLLDDMLPFTQGGADMANKIEILEKPLKKTLVTQIMFAIDQELRDDIITVPIILNILGKNAYNITGANIKVRVSTVLKELEEKGYLSYRRQTGGGDWNQYESTSKTYLDLLQIGEPQSHTAQTG